MDKIRLGITHGDINGISYEIIIKTLLDKRIADFCVPILYGSPKVAAYHRKAINIDNFSLNHINDATDANPKRANVINVIDDNIRVELGKSTEAAGESSFLALEAAVNDLQVGKIDALLTAPINKHNIQRKDFEFKGHTEYLAQRFNVENFLMLMISDELKVGVVTGHVPVSQIADHITKEAILKKIKVLNHSLKYDFGIRKPKIAVLGLNPHIGDEGLVGIEEQQIIIPALDIAREENIIALGPYPADGFFGNSSYYHFDAVLAMYHDQGLAPFKALAKDGGVNFTAGLPFVRTSPDHGTAYEIAGDGKASPDAFRKALYQAIDIHKTRNKEEELEKNAPDLNE
ncbi:MAG: 4-hydroxythreonine-4-phosphate dehydrogenase PdxA [Candidatus Delongbacteria bacterium]|jgi:4-hydroxythreonine-4-phosphate dehydrogenase|nr:4-hydroxythreonine-4-phosphate dehydrogenase PdxA [Candidatus Delongbacteria bacterium]